MTIWTPPKNWATGELVSADLLNTHLRDNLAFLHTPPSARVYNSANISIPQTTWTTLTFNSERWDNDDIHDTMNNTDRLVCKTAGKYLIAGQVEFATNANGTRWARIFLNGTTEIARDGQAAISVTPVDVSTIFDLTVNDYVTLKVYQEGSGGALNVLASASYSPEFMMVRIG